jgi:hypothetical protein
MTIRAFTGPLKLTKEQRAFVLAQVEALPPADEVRTGGAFGVDTEACLASLKCLPDASHVIFFPAAECNTALDALQYVPTVRFVRCPREDTRADTYRTRNRMMLDGATELVAFVREPVFYRSGTWMTINLARSANIRTVDIIVLPAESGFDTFVRELERDPAQKAANDAARERLRGKEES